MSTLRGPLVSAATALAILAASLLLLLTPVYIHPVLDAARSAAILGVSPDAAHDISDRTVAEVLLGPGTFSFAMPGSTTRFYDEAEAGHLRDVRIVLFAFLGVAAIAAVTLASQGRSGRHAAWFWRAVARGAATLGAALAVVGVFFLVAFDAAFELFHRIFFPGGNWAFDPTSQRLVQLYPVAFWQLTSAALGVLAIGGGAITWWLASRRARASGRREESRNAVAARSIGRIEVAR